MLRLLALVTLASALAFAAGAEAHSDAVRTSRCGSITVRLGGNDYSYRVKIASGPATCTAARSVLRGFIARAVRPRGWFCTRGHSRDPWAASCARTSPRALVRAYLIAG